MNDSLLVSNEQPGSTPATIPVQIEARSAAGDTDSKAFGISIRGWIAVLLLTTVCVMSILGKTVTEPLYSASIAALAFYFGHAKPK